MLLLLQFFTYPLRANTYGQRCLCNLYIVVGSLSAVVQASQAASLPAQHMKEAHSPPSFYVQHIVFVHAHRLSPRARRRLTAPYLHSFLTAAKIQELIRDVRAYYIQKGYPTTEVKVIPGQSLQGGVLKLQVVQGFIEHIRLGQQRFREKVQIVTAFPGLLGKPLYLPALEQGLDQINTLASNQATLKILPGQLPGGSIIQIDNRTTYPFRVDVGVDNLGDEATGRLRGKLVAGLDNLFSINDTLTAQLFSSQPKQIAGKTLLHQSWVGSLAFPVGSYSFASTYTATHALTPLQQTKHTIRYQTQTSSMALQVKKGIGQYLHHKLWVRTTLTSKHTSSSIEDTPLHNQERRLTIGNLGLDYTGSMGGGQCIVGIDYYQGLPWFEALRDAPSLPAHQPKAQFTKLHLNVHWLHFKPLARQILLNYQAKLTAQYSPDTLFDSEQFSAHGLDQVRGLQQHCAGSQGLGIRNELVLHRWWTLYHFTKPLQLFVGIDMACLQDKKKATALPEVHYYAGWACGGRYAHQGVHFDLTYARPLHQQEEKEAMYQVCFNLTLSLHHMIGLLAQ